MRMKIDLYRRLTRVTARDEVGDLRAEMLDRFGPPPPQATNLIRLAELRIAAARWQIESIGREEGYIVMFTVLFAIGRLPGWIAHWMEMHANPAKKICRPRQIYTGALKRDYTPLDKRG